MSLSLLSFFAIPDYSLMNPFRILKFILLIFTGILGFFGFTIFLTFILAELVSLNSFGVPYMAPLAPFNAYDFRTTLITNITMDSKRPNFLRTKDRVRTGKYPGRKKQR
jgi:spore germination protein KA